MTPKPQLFGWFWLIFCPLFVATLFIPVCPIDYGPVRFVLPVWCAYAFLSEELFLALPIAATHSFGSYFIARLLSQQPTLRVRFSMAELMAVIAGFATMLALISALQNGGFSIFFLVLVTGVCISNWLQRRSVYGKRVPGLHRNVTIALTINCVLLLMSLANELGKFGL